MSESGPGDLPLSDRLLRSWLRCRRRAWLDRHGPLEQRQWSAHRALSLEDQLRCFQLLLPQRPGHGEHACARGEEGVVGLRLKTQLRSAQGSLTLEAHPPLLQKVPGASRWGAHAYRPVLARQGRNLTREHRLMLALWGWLLAEHQQGEVPRALALGRGPHGLEREQLALTPTLRRQAEESLLKLAGELASPEPPPLVNDRKKCVLCGWRSVCDADASAEGHLSEVSGIGGKRRDLLHEVGITSLGQLAGADPEQLAEALAVHGEQHREVAPQLVLQAQVQAARCERLRCDDGAQPLPALPELLQAPGVLIYDIEADPDARDDFLHGFLKLPRSVAWPTAAQAIAAAGVADRQLLPGADYHPLLALQEHGERRLWQRLAGLLERHPDWPVLHYGETESVNLLRLAERQGADRGELQRLRSRLIDVHQRLRRHWVLPVNSYGLKAVAHWQGFHWSQPGVDGARCLLWWRQWRLRHHPQEGQRQVRLSQQQLGRILTYNRDDCLATWVVARWLLDRDSALAAPVQRD